MDISSTALYPRYLPNRLPIAETVTIVGQVLSLDEATRRLTIQPDTDSTLLAIQIHQLYKW